LEQKYEGIMIRNINSPYKLGPSRSSDLIKYKPMITEEFEIIPGEPVEAIIWYFMAKI
jgi:ATP-dependent DNA ligase